MEQRRHLQFGAGLRQCIKLSPSNEPQILERIALRVRFENVVLDPETRIPNYADDSLTENTRAAYQSIHRELRDSGAGRPSQDVCFNRDAFGVMLRAKLTPEQAMFHLVRLQGESAGTEPE